MVLKLWAIHGMEEIPFVQFQVSVIRQGPGGSRSSFLGVGGDGRPAGPECLRLHQWLGPRWCGFLTSLLGNFSRITRATGLAVAVLQVSPSSIFDNKEISLPADECPSMSNRMCFIHWTWFPLKNRIYVGGTQRGFLEQRNDSDTFVVNTCYYTFVQTHRVYHTHSEPYCRPWIWGGNDVSMQADRLWQMSPCGGGCG